MAAYNAERFLAEAVDSVLNQSAADFELIVTDDGSTDATAAILADYQRRDARVKVVTQANAGPAAARNTAITESAGDFVAVMDADDIAHPKRLEMQREFLRENSECAAVSCRCELIDESGNLLKKQSPRSPLQTPGRPLQELLQQPPRINQTTMLRVDRVGRGPLYRPWFRGVLEDFDCSLRFAERHASAYLNDPPLYQYRQYRAHGGNVMSTDPVLCWHYWCAAALSAHCRRGGGDDPVDAAAMDESPPRSLLSAVAALPSPVRAACIKNARHWCRRLLANGNADGAEQIVSDATEIAGGDLPALRQMLFGVMFYALRARCWRLAGRLLASLGGRR